FNTHTSSSFIYPLSLHDALPIFGPPAARRDPSILGLAPFPASDEGERDAISGAGGGVGGRRMRRTELVFERPERVFAHEPPEVRDRKSTRLNSSHQIISNDVITS